MIKENNKKIITRHRGVTQFLVIFLISSFLFGENILAANDYSKATAVTPISTTWNNSISNYDKPINGTLSSFEWNGLAYDFVKTWATSTMTGPLGIGTTASNSYILDVNGSIHATNFLGSLSGTVSAPNVSSGSFGANTGGGNYSFLGNVGIGTNNPGVKLDVGGVIKSGGNYYNILSYNQNGTPANGVKIKTNIPYMDSSQMPTIIIEGYDYGQANPIGISLVWYVYGGSFVSYRASSWGNTAPVIKLANEGGFVTIHLSWLPYYARFTVRAYATGMSEHPSWFNGWTVVDEVAGTTNQVTVSYANTFPGAVNFAGSGIWNSSGNVGIGTTNPTQKLDIVGNAIFESGGAIYLRNSLNNASTKLSDNGSTGVNLFTINTGGADRFSVNNSGNVGIGTTAPNSKLTLSGGDFEIDHNKSIKVSSSTSNTTLLFGNYADSLGFYYGTSTQATNKTVSLAVEGDVKADRLCIEEDCKAAWSEIVSAGGGNQWITSGNNIYNSNSGNVGIGTTNPGHKLHINQSGASTTYNVLYLTHENIANSNLWIGTNPSNSPVAAFQNNNVFESYAPMIFSAALSNNYLSFGTGRTGATFTETMRITGGKVGIGTTTPISTLHVNGTITANSFSGPLAGTVNAPNVSAGAFAANTGGGNFSFPGNLGIGTTNPVNLLGLQATTDSQRIINLYNGRTAANSYVSIGSQYSTGNSNVNSEVRFGNENLNGAPGYLSFATSPTNSSGLLERLRITSVGNVGIGTTNPTAKLHIVGTKLKITDTLTLGLASEVSGQLIDYGSNFGQLGDVNSAYAGGFFRIDLRDANPTEFFNVKYVPAGGSETTPFKLSRTGDIVTTGNLTVSGTANSSVAGNFGIGTTNPTAKLYINSGGGANSGVVIRSDGSTGGYASLDYVNKNNVRLQTGLYDSGDAFFYMSSAGNKIGFYTNDLQRMTIAKDGNVGIGTTTPSEKLEVNGNLKVNGSIIASGISGITVAAPNVSAGAFAANTGGGNFSFPGNLGIGTTAPSGDLHIKSTNPQLLIERAAIGNSSRLFFMTGGSYIWNFGSKAGTNDFSITDEVNSATSRLQIKAGASTGPNVYIDGSTGNVGIGTTAPNSKLTLSDGDFEIDHNKSIKVSSATVNTTLLLGNYADGQAFAYGSTAPNKSASLAVEGDVKADRLCIEEDCKAAWSEIVTAGGGNQWITSGNNIYNSNSGNVGIGTTVPATSLDIFGINKITHSAGNLYIHTSDTQAIDKGGQITFGGSYTDAGAQTYFGNIAGRKETLSSGNAAGYLSFSTSLAAGGTQTEKMRITSTGSVGIGTTTPGSYKLYVNGNTNINGTISATTFSGPLAGTVSAPNVSAGAFAANTGGGNFSFPGNVGIGTTNPSLAKFQIEAGNGVVGQYINGGTTTGTDLLKLRANAPTQRLILEGAGGTVQTFLEAGGSIGLFGTVTNHDFRIRTNYVDRMTFDTNGNVGIGTTAPTEKLEIVGALKFANTTSTCDSIKTGTLKYDAVSGQSYLCDGTRWLNQKNCGVMTDDEGKTYATVQIGGQCWTAENINIGTMLAAGTTEPNTNDQIIEKWCYNNDANNCALYGGLYNWNEAMRGSQVSGARGICAAGWHIPTDAEYNTLEKTILGLIASPNAQYACNMSVSGWQRCADSSGTDVGGVYGAGKSLKAVGVGSGNGAGNDLVGFAGKLSGLRYTDGSFGNLGSSLYLWSSTPSGASNAWRRGLVSSYSTVYRVAVNRAYGFSVRCLRD